MRQTFETWYDKVCLAVRKQTGLSANDLPDCPYRDWYEDGVTPSAAAKRAIRNARDG